MNNYRVNVITPPRLGGPFYWAKNLVKLLNDKGITSHHVYEIKDLIAAPFCQDADIVHAALPIGIRFWKKKFVFTVKGDYSVEKLRWRGLNSLAVKNADIVTTPSEYLKKRLDLADAHVIPNAIFSEKYRMVDHKDSSDLNLITVTNFAFRDKSEGVLNIIRLLEGLQKSTDKKITFTIVGGGPYCSHVMKAAQGSRIPLRFTGFISNPRTELEKSDIFLYHSPHDNFPNVFLEAMASGLPVVTNAVGASAEIIDSGKTGFIATDDENYQEIVLKLISDTSLRAEQGKNARTRVETHFDWNCIVPEYIAIYTDLLSS